MFSIYQTGKQMQKLRIKDTKNMSIAVYQEIQRSEDSKYYHRLHGILMAIKGYDCYTIADIFGQDSTTIQRWVNNFNKKGFAGLSEGERPGRPRSLTAKQWDELGKDLRKPPIELNYNQVSWDGKLMAAHLKKKFKVELGTRQCQRIFNMMGFRLRKPRPVIANASPEAQRALKKTPLNG